jgi:Sec23/Sec24 zinc finger
MNPAGRPVAVSSMGSAGIVRCKRCRTYINPFVTWTDGGRSVAPLYHKLLTRRESAGQGQSSNLTVAFPHSTA